MVRQCNLVLLMTKNVLVYGDGAMAAYGIGNKLNGIITMPANAIGSAVATIVGQNVGARQIKEQRKAIKLQEIWLSYFYLLPV